MKNQFITTVLVAATALGFAQDKTTVTATSSDISDNLDLRAVASIFGEAKNLEEFEQRINDPKNQISNLDLNNDNQVDYIRVIETVEGNDHIVVLQDVIGKDQYQDIATVEVQRDSNNNVRVQVVGDVYMYGNNYIYEPVYGYTPVICNNFWVPNYSIYYSPWYWGYYPRYYSYWAPMPLFRYRNHIGLYINFGFQYNYVNYRYCADSYGYYYNNRRHNHYGNMYPDRDFSRRNVGYSNRYELDRANPRRDSNLYNGGSRDNGNTRGIGNTNPRNTNAGARGETSSPRSNSASTPRNNSTPRSTGASSPRSNSGQNSSMNTPRSNSNPRSMNQSTPSRSESGTRASSGGTRNSGNIGGGTRSGGEGNSRSNSGSGNSRGGRSSGGGRSR